MRLLVKPELYRAPAIVRDLTALCGDDWADTLPVLAAAQLYAEIVATAAEGDGSGLIAHAYTRYLGDLSGAQFLRRSLQRQLELPDDTLGFFDFPLIPDHTAFKADYRTALDHAGRELAGTGTVVAAALQAFQCNIDLSEAVQAAAAPAI